MTVDRVTLHTVRVTLLSREEKGVESKLEVEVIAISFNCASECSLSCCKLCRCSIPIDFGSSSHDAFSFVSQLLLG